MTKMKMPAGITWQIALLLSLPLSCLLVSSVTASEQTAVQWDEQATQEVTAALHQLHEVWNSGDIRSLKKILVGDDVLVTFELDPATHTPIKLSSKKEMWDFVDNTVNDVEAESGRFVLEHPKLNCRATQHVGICTEQCAVTVKKAGSVEEKYGLWSTGTAVKYEDGWKWIQWHMSTAGPVELYKDGKLVWKGDKAKRPKDLEGY